MHAAERVGVEGKVVSRDVSERKCDLIRENAERLGITNIVTQVHDAKIHDKSLEGTADILYLDVPCSGLGILGRKSDIKLSVKPALLTELTHLQWDIVKASWDYVKVGGYLIYSTCTVNKEENEEMVKRICEELPFERVDITDKLPKALRECRGIIHEADSTTDNSKEETTEKTTELREAESFNCQDAVKDNDSIGQIQLIPGEYGTDGFFRAKRRRTN